MMGDKQKEDEHINEVLRDWKLLAQKADYFLFWVFFTITTITRSVLSVCIALHWGCCKWADYPKRFRSFSGLFIFILPLYNRGRLL